MFKLSIISQEKVMFEGELESLVVPSTKGELGILSNHYPMLAELAMGGLRLIFPDKTEQMLFVAGGFVEVSYNQVTVLADFAERLDEMEAEKVAQARAAAQEAMQNARNTVEREVLMQELNLQLMRERLAGIAKHKQDRN